MASVKKLQSPNTPFPIAGGEHMYVPYAFDLKCRMAHNGFMQPAQVYSYLQLLFPMLGKWKTEAVAI